MADLIERDRAWIEVHIRLPDGRGASLRFDDEWARDALLRDLAKTLTEAATQWERKHGVGR
jgi:hypothetical protein